MSSEKQGQALRDKNPALGFLSKNKIVVVFVLLFVALSIVQPAFFTYDNITNYLRQIATNAVLAIGMTLVMTTGSFDLSVGSVLAVSGIVAGMLAKAGVPISLVIIVGVAIGAAFGAANGLAVAIFKLPSFIVTLAMMQVARGIAYLLSGGFPVSGFASKYLSIGQGYFLYIPIPVWILIIVAVIVAVMLAKTRFGRHVYFVGGNEEASRISGINIFSVRVRAHTLCGMMAGLAGVILTFRVASAMPGAGQGYEMDAIAAAVIGGCSLSGGISSITGTVLGALILGIINNGLNLLGVTTYPQMIIKGLIIFAAVLLDTYSTKARGKS